MWLIIGIGIKKILLIYVIFLLGITIFFFLDLHNLAFIGIGFVLAFTLFVLHSALFSGIYIRRKRLYSHHSIIEVRDFLCFFDSRKNVRELFSLYSRGYLSRIRIHSKERSWVFFDSIRILLSGYKGKIKHILILGGGGGALAKTLLDERFNEIEGIDVVEIDLELINVAKRYFVNHEKIHFIHDDAFQYIKQINKLYDLIIVDIFQDSMIHPLVNTEAFAISLRKHINKQGNIVVNLGFGKCFTDMIVFWMNHFQGYVFQDGSNLLFSTISFQKRILENVSNIKIIIRYDDMERFKRISSK